MKKPQGFEKKLKVRKKSDFLSLRSNSRKFAAKHWIVFFKENDLGHPRLGISISTSFGNAVRRNYFRRWLRDQFRTQKAKLHSLDCHFVAKRKPPLNQSKSEFRKELDADLKRFLHWLG